MIINTHNKGIFLFDNAVLLLITLSVIIATADKGQVKEHGIVNIITITDTSEYDEEMGMGYASITLEGPGINNETTISFTAKRVPVTDYKIDWEAYFLRLHSYGAIPNDNFLQTWFRNGWLPKEIDPSTLVIH